MGYSKWSSDQIWFFEIKLRLDFYRFLKTQETFTFDIPKYPSQISRSLLHSAAEWQSLSTICFY